MLALGALLAGHAMSPILMHLITTMRRLRMITTTNVGYAYSQMFYYVLLWDYIKCSIARHYSFIRKVRLVSILFVVDLGMP